MMSSHKNLLDCDIILISAQLDVFALDQSMEVHPRCVEIRMNDWFPMDRMEWPWQVYHNHSKLNYHRVREAKQVLGTHKKLNPT